MAMGSTGRLRPLEEAPDRATEQLWEAAASGSGLGFVPNFHRVLAHHPEVLGRISAAGLGRLPDGDLSVRHRELLVLRTAARCAGSYEWAHHRRRAAERGLSPDDVGLAWHGAAAAVDSVDRVLLAVADELHDGSNVSDAVWSEVCRHVGERGAIEAVAVVGWYHLVCFLGNAVRLEVEPGVDARLGLDDEEGHG